MCLLSSPQLSTGQRATFYGRHRLHHTGNIENNYLVDMQKDLVIKTERGEFIITNKKLINKAIKCISHDVDSQQLKEGK